MSADDRFQRLMDLFARAVELPADERMALVRASTGDDPTLRAELEAMLAADDSPVATVGGGARLLAGELAEADSRAVLPGPRSRREPVPVLTGEYRIIRLIGEGGMGSVYEAEQAMPRRRVAIKVVRSSFASRRILRRFAHEAHILGRLQHPGIAQIHEAGAGDPEKPDQAFFVMEYVDGVPLNAYADRHALGRDARLELVAKVGEAVAHAHQRGVIHRDLKPANILVDATGQPKVLDFGVARVTDGDAEISTQLTSIGQLVGTLPYMSPEQVAGDPDEVDVRSDVYALGVILYELLGGGLPLDVSRRSIPDAARAIREDEPTRLGMRAKECRGDVETIVHKALDKDRERRYQSAQELVADVRRFLAGEPIVARQHSAMYVIRKQLRRYQGAVAAAALMAIGLGAFAVQAWVQAERNAALAAEAEQARARAVDEATRADETATHLAEQLAVSHIERGRLFARTGNLLAAEDIIWPEFFRAPRSTLAYDALLELYMHEACVATRLLHPESATQDQLRAVATDASGSVVVCGGDDGRLSLLAMPDGRVSFQRTDAVDAVRALALDEGGVLAVGATDGQLVLRAPTTLDEFARIGAPRGAVRGLAALSGGVVVSGGEDRMVREWSVVDGSLVREWPVDGVVSALVSTPDGGVIATGTTDGAIRLWDREGRPLGSLEGHVGAVSAMTITADGALLVSGGIDRVIRFWDVRSRTLIESARRPNGTVRALRVGADGRQLVSVGWWMMDIWDMATRTVRRSYSLPEGPNAAAIVDGGRLAITLHIGDIIRLWETNDDGARRLLRAGEGSQNVATTRDGRLVAFGGAGPAGVTIQRTADGGVVATLPGYDARVRTLAFSSDDALLAVLYRDGRLVVWDVARGESVGERTGLSSETAASIAWHPARRLLAACGPGLNHSIIEVPSMREVVRCRTTAQALGVAWMPDGESFIGSIRAPSVAQWGIDGTLRREFVPPEGPDANATAWSLAIDPTGGVLAVGTWGKTVRLFDIASGEHLGELAGHAALVGDVLFSRADPNIVVSGGGDGTVRVWNVRQRQNVLTIAAAPGWELSDVALSTDGRTLFAASTSGEVTEWDLSYCRRHIAGNLRYQLERTKTLDPDSPEAKRLIAWSDDPDDEDPQLFGTQPSESIHTNADPSSDP
ncbi:MAG: serine/threonine-protein kinase [Phycisphaerales bacterium]